MKKIYLYRSDVQTLVDDEDFLFLSRYNWCLTKSGTNSYAAATVAGFSIAMHRLLMNPNTWQVVDHADQNGLNNQKGNLRVTTRAHNTANRKKFRGGGRYIGVSKKMSASGGATYIAMTYRGGTGQYHGTFATEIEAAKARDVAAKKIWGECVALNFPTPTDLKKGKWKPV